jgi:WD40 repeat protein
MQHSTGEQQPSRRRLVGPAGAMVLVVALAGVADQTRSSPPDRDEIRRLIKQLGSARYKDRENASRRLDAIGGPAWYPLCKAAANATDLETRRRADKLVRSIGKRLCTEVRHFGGPMAGYWLNRVAFTSDGRRAVATGGALIVYDLGSGRELYRVLELQFARPALALTRDGRYFLTGHQHDAVVHMGEVKSGKEVRLFRGHTAGVWGVALSPDQTRAVSGSQDGTVRLWDVKTGKELRVFRGAGGMVRCVAYAPDGRHVLSGHAGAGSDNVLRLWDVESGREVRRFPGHKDAVTAVAYLPGGRSFLSGSTDGTLRLWDVKTGKELRRMEHPGGVYDVAVSPDGRRALSAGFGDRLVRLWDLTDGGPLYAYEGHQGAVLGVAISADGRLALSSDTQYTVRLWRLPPPEGQPGGKPGAVR